MHFPHRCYRTPHLAPPLPGKRQPQLVLAHRVQRIAHRAVTRVQDGAAECDHEVQVLGVGYTGRHLL